ncbi:cytochrome c3 family protein [Geopsychrobacter electrodiphilus]|uniref:cytochrome c3 family protein n=1 Tax=Geopsychrobacter electrodiphilus TaxID=225196 RepID=UPI00037500CC|nr:cytochrome c3 family protein [Geopsychrobacter electrodiphilus]
MVKRLFIVPLLLLMLVSSSYALDIVYPGDGTYVIHSDFLIIQAGPNVDGLTLDIAGEKSDLFDISGAEYKAAFGDFLIVQPSWAPGKNTVKVEAYKAGKKVSDKTTSFFFQNNPLEPPPQGFKRFVMHTPEQEAFCVGCHNMNPTPDQLEMVGEKNPCASCHKRMLNHKYVHGPAGAWQCAYCHDSKSRPAKYQPRSLNGDLCAECHEDIIEKFKASKLLHGPVAVSMCGICHDSHASDYPAQVVLPVNKLCLGCHEGVDKGPHVITGFTGKQHPLEGVPDPSRPQRDLACSGCHDPHSGSARYYFQGGVTSRMMLCQRCHQK